MECQQSGCLASATHVPRLKVWALGHRKVPSQGVEVRIGLQLCARHARELSPADVLTDDGWSQITDIVTREGGVEPDRETAEILISPIRNA